MHDKWKILLLLTCLLWLTGSCSPFYGLLIGYRGFRVHDSAEISKFISKNNIDTPYIIDSSMYVNEFTDVNDAVFHKDLFQPLQLRIYDSSKELVTWVVNCYVSGFPNLQWDKYINFDTIPPQYRYPENFLLDSLKNKEQFSYIIDFDGKSIDQNITEPYDYLFVIFASMAFNRQSRRLIHNVQQWISEYNDLNCKLVVAYSDPITIYLLSTPAKP